MLAAAATAGLAQIASGQITGTWKMPVNGSWGTANNWVNGTIPANDGDTADFSTLNLTSDLTVTLDGDRTVGNLVFGDTIPSNNWFLNTGTGGNLILLNSLNGPSITVNTGTTATINANVLESPNQPGDATGNPTPVTFSGGGVAAFNNLVVTEDVGGSGPGINGVSLNGGTVRINGTITLQANQNFDTALVSGNGTLQLRNATSSFSHPSLLYGALANSSADDGAIIPAGVTVDLGTGPAQWFTGNSNNNQFSVHNGDLNIMGNLTGTAGLTFSGAPHTGNPFSLVLGGDNSGWSGPLTIVEGSVVPYADGSTDLGLGPKNAVTFAPGVGQDAILYLYGQNVSIGSLSGSGAGTMSIRNAEWAEDTNGGHTTHLSTATLTVNQTVAGTYPGLLEDGPSDRAAGGSTPNPTYFPLALVKQGAATLTLTGNNTYTGGTTINGGTLEIAGAAGANPLGSGNIAINSGGTLELTQSNVFGNGVASPTQSITITGGTLTNNGSFNALGPVTLQGGSIAAGPGQTAGQREAFSLNGTITSLAAATPSTLSSTGAGSGYHLSGNTAFNVAQGTTPSGQDLVISGNLLDQDFDQSAANRAGGLTKTGPGTLVLGGANTYTGPTTVNGGKLLITGSNASTAQMSVAAGTLALGPSGSIHNNTIAIASGANLDTSAVAGAYTLAGAQTLIAGHAGGGAGNDVTGSLSFTNGTTLDVGGIANPATLGVSGNLSFIGSTVRFDLATPGVAGGANNDLVKVGGNLKLDGLNGIAIAPGQGSLANGSYTLFTYGGTLSGSAADLSLAGALAGNTRQAFTFSTDAAAKTVSLNVAGSAASLVWAGNGTNNNWDVKATQDWKNGGAADQFFNLDNVSFTDAGSNSPALNISGTVVPGSISVNSAQNYTFGGTGAIGGSTGLTKAGSGTLAINTTNSFAGPVAINGGVLSTASLPKGGSASPLGAGNAISIGAGTLNYTGTSDTSDRSVALTNAGATINVNSAGGSLTLTGPISGSGNLNKTGPGTLALSGNSDYTGTTLVSGGTLGVASDASLGTAPAAPIAADISLAGGNLQFIGPASLSASRGISLSGAATIDTQSNTVTINGPISGSAPKLTKAGGGTLILNGTNTYVGKTAVSGGTLQLPGDAGLGVAPAALTADSITLQNGGTVAFTADTVTDPNRGITLAAGASSSGGGFNSGGHSLTLSGPITGPGSLALSGGGTYTVASANNYQGGTTVGGSISQLNLNDPTSLGTGKVTLQGITWPFFNFPNSATVSNAFVLPANASGSARWETPSDAGAGGILVTLGGQITGGSAGYTFFIEQEPAQGGGIILANPANTFTVKEFDLNRGAFGVAANGALGNPNNLIFLDDTRSGSSDADKGFFFTAPNINLPNPVQFNDYTNITVGGNGDQFAGNIIGPGGDRSQPYYIFGGTNPSGTSIGSLTLSGNNTFTQNIMLSPDVTLVAASPTAFGTGNTITDPGGATIAFNNAGVMTASASQTLVLNGTGTQVGGTGRGSLVNLAGNNTFNGNVVLGTDSTISVVNAGDTLTLGALDVTGAASGGTSSFALTKTGAGTLTALNHLAAGAAAGSVTVAPGVSLAQLAISGGTFATGNANGQTGALNVTGGVTIASGAKLRLGTIGTIYPNAVSGGLTVNTGATVDVGNQELLINYGSGPDVDAATRALITTGYNAGKWTGTGITSSVAAGNPSRFAVGYADLTASKTEEVRFTYAGDATLDGKVDVVDLGVLATNFGKKSGATWQQGDFNYDGKVDVVDLGILATNFGAGGTLTAAEAHAAFMADLAQFPQLGQAFSAVPEPGSIGLLAGAGGALLIRRRRQRGGPFAAQA